MQYCKTVTLRTRPIKNGMLSFYLDYYPGYRDIVTMKTTRHESLGIYIYADPQKVPTHWFRSQSRVLNWVVRTPLP